MVVAKDILGLEVEERPIALDELGDFAECGLCGTAAVISPVGKIVDHDRVFEFAGMGPVIQKLYDTLRGIQMGTIDGPEGWVKVIE
jgi:branched-chain amino acid aminotransferase